MTQQTNALRLADFSFKEVGIVDIADAQLVLAGLPAYSILHQELRRLEAVEADYERERIAHGLTKAMWSLASIEVMKAHDRRLEQLRFIERWVNHHGQKPHITPQEVLSVIQHYPPIKDITKSYEDGVLPSTPDPWAERDQLRAQLAAAHDSINSQSSILEQRASRCLELANEVDELRAQVAESESERMEQSRLLGMSAERELALRAQVERLQGGEPVYCPKCGGSGETTYLSNGGPDAEELPCVCPHCEGHQTLDAAYRGVAKLLEAEHTKYLQLYAKLYFGQSKEPAVHEISGRTIDELWLETGKLRSEIADLKIALKAAQHAAPALVPLTDEQIDKLPWGPHDGNPITFAEGLRDFARAIERAHGIGQPAGGDAP